MNASEESFQEYLCGEVDAAGKRYERAVEKMLAITGGAKTGAERDLLEATEDLGENLRLYIGALRRLANFATHQATMRRERLAA